VLKLFLVMLYAGAECEMVLQNDVMDKHLNNLINMCYKYEVTHVFPTLSKLVKRSLTIENCCGYFVCATEFGLDDNCADHISSYIKTEWGKVIRSDGFMDLAYTHPMLAVQLVRLEEAERVTQIRGHSRYNHSSWH
jgi:hypothetical protein